MRLKRQNCRTILSVLPVLWTAAACELSNSLEDLAVQLGNPENTTAESPGKRLSPSDKQAVTYSERYSSVGVDGNNADGAYVTTLNADRELLIIPFSKRAKTLAVDRPEGCNLGPIAAFKGAFTRTDDSKAVFDAKLSYLSPGESGNTLRFADLGCNVVDVEVPGANFPLANFGPRDGFVVQDNELRLWFVDPWSAKKQIVAENLSVISRNDVAMVVPGPSGEKWLWTLESGELVARNSSFDEVFRAGHGIQRVTHTASGSDKMRFMYTDAERSVYTFTAAAPDDVKQIGADACDNETVRFNEGNKGLEALYVACETRSLTLYSFTEDTTTPLIDDVVSFRIVNNVESGPMLLYILDAEPGSRVGPMYAKWGTQNRFFLGENGNLDLSSIEPDGTQQAVINWSATGGDLTYSHGLPDEEPSLVASNVVVVGSGWTITDFDGQNGKLQRLKDGKLKLVHKSAAAVGLVIDAARDRALFISHIDNGLGQLTVADGVETRDISARVGDRSFQFTQQLGETVTAISGDDAGLHLYGTESNADLAINTGVSEVLEIAWPEKGFLYSAPDADEPGLYFAKLIP